MEQDAFSGRTFDLFTGAACECDLLITLLADAGIDAFRTEYANIYGATPLFATNCRVRVMESVRKDAEAVLQQYLESTCPSEEESL